MKPLPSSDRNSTTKALTQNRCCFATLMANLPGFAYRGLNTPQWPMEFVSEGCRELTGYSPEELGVEQLITYSELVHPDDRDPLWEQVQQALHERRPYRVEYRIRTRDGQEKWVWEQGSGVLSSDGELQVLEGFITDITQQKRLQAQMQARQDELLTLNARLEERFEERTTELKTSHEEWRKENDSLLLEVEALRAASSAQEQQLLTVTSVMDEMLQKIESQRNALKEKNKNLRELNAYIRRIDDTMDSLLVVADLTGSVKQVNRAFSEQLGWDEESLDRLHLDNLFRPDVLESLGSAAVLTKVSPSRVVNLLKKRGHLEREMALNRKISGPTDAIYLVKGELLHSHQGKLQGVLLTATDITELKQREKALRDSEEALQQAKAEADAANRSKGKFLANMSHEIRTPMNGIIGMSELLGNTELSTQQQEYLSLIQQSADTLLRLLNDILDFSKIEAGKLELEAIDFNLRDTLDDTLQTLAMRASEKNLELIGRIPPKVPDKLIGDPGRLRQIIVNLVGNAIKFTERGEILVDVRLQTLTVNEVVLAFSIHDTGIGIPTKQRQHIFESFRQVDSSISRRFGGTGLGLAISSQLVDMMGGEMSVESTVDVGTTFKFTLVLKRQQRPSTSIPKELSALHELPVLIVDDNATNRLILEEMLVNWDMKPMTADSGDQALIKLEQAQATGTPYYLMLLDAMMPGMDGFELAQQLRANPQYSAMAIIMLSSVGQPEKTAHLQDLGIARCLTKPVKQSNLLNAILSLKGLVTQPVETQAPIPDTTPLHILLAEDGLINQKVATKLLEQRGHSVVIANNGKEAVACFERETFDLVLMDVQMPEMNGFQATARIRQLESGSPSHLPIIAMTANVMKGDREQCLTAGMDDYIPKPIRSRQLYDTIEQMVPAVTVEAVTPAPLNAPPPSPQDASSQDASAQKAAPDTLHPDASEVFDPKGALERVDGDADLLKEMVELFYEECPKLMTEIHESLVAGDLAALRRAAHTLKGTADVFAAKRTVTAAQKLEMMARKGVLESAPEAVLVLESEVQSLKQVLKTL